MTDQMPFSPATAHALGCGMNNGRPVIACICGLPNKGLSEPGAMTDQIPPMPEAKSTEYEIFCGDECVAVTDTYEDARHYAMVYSQDGEVRIYEVQKIRNLIDSREATR